MPGSGTSVAEAPQRDEYRALPAQHGMILNSLRYPDDGVDVVQVTLDWADPLERRPFEAAWHEAARRHPVLRTAFRLHDGDGMAEDGMVQMVDPDATIDIRWRDLPPPPATGPDQPFEAFLLADRRERFEVTRAPLARLTIVRRVEPSARAARDAPDAPARRTVLTVHHALVDGRSLRMLVEEVAASYAAARDGVAVVNLLRPPFREYVRWWPAAGTPTSQEFWTSYLADMVLPRPLPGFLGPHAPGTAEPATLETALSHSESALVRQAVRGAGLSSSTLVSSAWALLRQRYGGVTDVAVAVTRSCRHDSIPNADAVIGPMINTVPLRVRIDPRWSAGDLLAAVNDGILAIRKHQLAPLGSILAWAGLPADTEVLDSLVMFERQQLQTYLSSRQLGITAARMDRLPSYPLTLCAFDEPRIRLGLIWDRRRFLDGAPQRILGQLAAALVELARMPTARLADLSLGADDEAGLRAAWNRTEAAYPRDATIPALFAAQVARYPGASALVSGDREWTYAELDRRSNALAWMLRRRGVAADTPVAVALPRGPALIEALLGVLKAGGAYVPIDPDCPAPRAAAMIATAGARIVLATADTAAAMPAIDGVHLVRVDAEPGPPDGPTAPPDVSHPLSLAYISFTSGSTGVPKGVAVPHRAVVRLISDPSFASLGPGERLLQLAPVAFDASTLEIWGALLTGGTVVVAPPGPLGLPEIASLLRSSGVTVAWLTAGLFHQLAETDVGALAGVRRLLAGGDVLNPDVVRTVLAARQGRPLVNGYGPTENTTFTACHVMTGTGPVEPMVPIGRPVQHTTVHILDERGRPVPVGVPGELYAGGDGVARGYAGNAAATARAFVPDPSGPGARRYRTGDLARWRADGTIEFLGRRDDQIKIRGFRVEPGEVEAVLRACPGVREAVVVTAGDGAQRHLVGYVTPADGTEGRALRPSSLREFLAGRLPEYLVPSGFAVLDRLPLNANGKVDRAALPAPEPETSAAASPPRGPTEQRLAEIWRPLLPPDGPRAGQAGRDDSFFALGGNSLSAARLMFRIREVFGVDLPLGTFYEAPTLAACAAAIDGAAEGAAGGADAAPAPQNASAAIGRRDRGRYRVPAAQPGIVSRDRVPPAQPTIVGRERVPPAQPTIVGRRDRSRYRVPEARPTPGRPGEPAPHLVALADDWVLWRTVCVRAAGLPIDLLAVLGDGDLARAADAVVAARADPDSPARERAEASYAAEFPAAVRRLGTALHQAAGLPALREAVAWQNRHALATGVDVLERHAGQPGRRNTKHRQHEALVASYLQRYCAKNDTIGFFGPVGWSQIDDRPGIGVTPTATAGPADSLGARVTYLEGWAVRAIMADHLQDLRPWLVPRRMPFLDVDGSLLRLPLAPPAALTPAEAAVMRAADGVRDAREVAAAVLADPDSGVRDVAEVFALLARLADGHRLAWQVDIAPQDIRPERSAAAILSRVSDERVRGPAEAALGQLTAARDELSGAAGDADRVAAAMAGLEATFTRMAGLAPTRRAGAAYAGRTLAYEECSRGDAVRLGADALDGIRAALAMVLDSARWFAADCGQRYAQHFDRLYRQRAATLGTEVVPFADFWLFANDALFDRALGPIEPAVRELGQRWSQVLDLPPGARQVRYQAADLTQRVASAFPARPRPWPMAVHHSPDLMIVGADAANGGPFTWVLGELHPSVVTVRFTSWLEFHDAPDELRAALRHDLGAGAVFLAETAEDGGPCSRLSNALTSPGDLRLVFAHDSCGYDPAATLRVGECDLIDSPAGLRVRRRDGTFERGLLEVLGDVLSAQIAHVFRLTPPGGHVPRVTIDDLVVSRESWSLPAAEPAFDGLADESARYRQARAWAAGHGLPRHVFLRCAGERKPIYADLTSLASIDLISRALRRCRREAGADATITVTEMLPAPEQAWLADARGRRYTAELRMVAVDQKQGG
jgi:amino acid adenylation domain-containing protein